MFGAELVLEMLQENRNTYTINAYQNSINSPFWFVYYKESTENNGIKLRGDNSEGKLR